MISIYAAFKTPLQRLNIAPHDDHYSKQFFHTSHAATSLFSRKVTDQLKFKYKKADQSICSFPTRCLNF